MVSIWYLMFRYLQMNMEVNPGDLVSIPVIAVGTIAFYWIPDRLCGGFPMLAAVGSFCCFTFIWCINKDVCAKMAAWKCTKLAE